MNATAKVKVSELHVGDTVTVRLGRDCSATTGVVTYAERGRTYLRYPVPVSAYAPDGVGKMRISHRHIIHRHL